MHRGLRALAATGTCLESGKRVAMIPILYFQSLLWLIQIVFMGMSIIQAVLYFPVPSHIGHCRIH